MPDPRADKLLDIVSLVVMRMLAKRTKGELSESEFTKIAGLDPHSLLVSVVTPSERQELEDIAIGEFRKTVELLSQKSCGKCKGTGVQDKKGVVHQLCNCISLENYRGDKSLPREDMLSNKYFTGEFSKRELGMDRIILNMALFISRFIGI